MSPTPTVVGHWETAGTMATSRVLSHAVALDDGRVLVVGTDDDWCCGVRVRADSSKAETWDPSRRSWSSVAGLNRPRADFVAVPLGDGRVLVTGGVNAVDGAAYGHQSYSSTYIYDPMNPDDGWTKAALLGTARTAPLAAALPDGRVLVAGGYYLSGDEARVDQPTTVVAAYRPGTTLVSRPSGAILANIDPDTFVPALATAELYDPTRDAWSPTGSMQYARFGAEAVTLADGRVLVVGSRADTRAWNQIRPSVEDQAYGTAEIFDPATGRFSLTGYLPPIDWAAVAPNGLLIDSEGPESIGRLVALADGGALLVGHATLGFGEAGNGRMIRVLRFDPLTDQWSEVDRTLYAGEDFGADPGHSRDGALAARLADGRVLVVGGEQPIGDPLASAGYDGSYVAATSADLFDPDTNTWAALPPMPEPRAGGAAVPLTDGSVLIVGGYNETVTLENRCADNNKAGLTTAVRFVPGP